MGRKITDPDKIYEALMADEDFSPYTKIEEKGKEKIVVIDNGKERKVITELEMS